MEHIDPRTLALGLEIRAEASAQRMTLADLAKRAGVSRASLYNWIDGERAMPLTGLVAIADALRVQPHELLHRGEDRARRNAEQS